VKTCFPKEEVKIYTYMYHYIRNKNWDKPNAGFIRNAVITENFDAQMKKFSELEKNEKIKIIFLSDLEKFQKEDCYPHKNLVILTSDDGWDDNYINLYPIAKKYNTKFHLSIISSYTKENRYDNFMTKAEVQEVSLDPNFEIIGHTFAHIDLRNLNDFYLSRELCSSKDSLELMTETQINTIIYPAGKYNSQTINKSKICGYKYGFTTKS
jgi:peptidoglycan/xylan/chitin deacetylase (PgdA/CDA1 family)